MILAAISLDPGVQVSFNFFFFHFMCAYSVFVNEKSLMVGTKRSFGELDDDEEDLFGSKKVFFPLYWTFTCFSSAKYYAFLIYCAHIIPLYYALSALLL